MRGSGAPLGMAPTHLMSKTTKALRGQVTCTGPHSRLVTKVVSLGLVLNCIKTHYCVHLCPFPKAQDTRKRAGWKENQSSMVSRTGPKFPSPITWSLPAC